MAIWQMKLDLIPRQRVLQIFSMIPITLPSRVHDETTWFEATPPEFEAGLAAILKRPYFDSGDLQYWGDSAGDEAGLAYNHGKLRWVWFAVDASRVSPKFIGDVCAFARELDCVLVEHRTQQIIEPEVSHVAAALRRSTAAKFMKDPFATLANLPPISLGGVLQPEEHRFKRWLNRLRRWAKQFHP